MFYTCILVIAVYLSFVSASIYPTQPVQATVWSAEQPMRVSWVEDWKYPLLSEMGPIDITLWGNTNTYLASLASGVDPTAKTRPVTVPGWALKHGFTYTLRFTTSKPIDTVVYSADFAIVPANTTSGTVAGTGGGAVAVATQGGTSTGTGTGTRGGSGSRTTATSTGSLTSATNTTSASNQFGSASPSGTPPPSGTLPGSGPVGGQRAASAGRRGVDVEKLKFRFVFVIWPVLMGITMAL